MAHQPPTHPLLPTHRPALPSLRSPTSAPWPTQHPLPAGVSIRGRAGLSLVETLIALSISAMLLTATMVAIDASFKSYATAAEQAATQASLRMVTHRLITLVRTSTAHGPLVPGTGVTLDGDTLTSYYLEVLDANNNIVRIEFKDDTDELWLTSTPAAGGSAVTQPILGGVTSAVFTCKRRLNDDGIWVLERGTMDITVQPGVDTTLALESGKSPPVRMIASTMPRKLADE